MAKTWFITGCSAGGIGEGIARAVLEKGDRAVVTARSTAKVEGIVADYAETAHKRSVAQNVNARQQPGDPLKAGYPIIKAIEADDTPLRLYLGSDALAAVRGALGARLEELEKWAEVSKTTDFAE